MARRSPSARDRRSHKVINDACRNAAAGVTLAAALTLVGVASTACSHSVSGEAVVHHGGAGTTAAGMRAGIPTLILWVTADQPIWAAQVKRLKVGSARRFSTTTQESLVAELRRILTRQYVTRACEVATQMTKPAESAATAADLLEQAASGRRCR